MCCSDSEESVRQRRQSKRSKRSADKKRRIEERVSGANQRWQKYSSIDYELIFFISRYYEQLPLCSACRNYFVTNRTHFLADNPRASLDYAADDALRSASQQSITLKQAAKARLIKDYDKQTDVIFHLCDSCLTKCKQIRNELKQMNFDKKTSGESSLPPVTSLAFGIDEASSTSSSSPAPLPAAPISPPSNVATSHPSATIGSFPLERSRQCRPISISHVDLHQLYVNNLIQYHQIKLQQLYQQSQALISTQQYDHTCLTDICPQQDLQGCLSQMQYHCLEALHLQYPGYTLSFPYLPSYSSPYLSYRHEHNEDEDDDSDESAPSDSSSSHTKGDEVDWNASERNVNQQRFKKECNEHPQSSDDRVTIETCHGLVEYCSKSSFTDPLGTKIDCGWFRSTCFS